MHGKLPSINAQKSGSGIAKIILELIGSIGAFYLLLFQSQASQQVGESVVFSQPVELGPHFEIDELKSALSNSFLQPLECDVVIAKTYMDKRYMEG